MRMSPSQAFERKIAGTGLLGCQWMLSGGGRELGIKPFCCLPLDSFA
jgi:hypothetical protein